MQMATFLCALPPIQGQDPLRVELVLCELQPTAKRAREGGRVIDIGYGCESIHGGGLGVVVVTV